MSNLIIISTKRDYDAKINGLTRVIKLNRLKITEITEIIKQYGITETHKHELSKMDLIKGIVLYEKMSLGGKQTKLEINIYNKIKTYFIETKNNLILVKKINKNNIYLYNVYNYLSNTVII